MSGVYKTRNLDTTIFMAVVPFINVSLILLGVFKYIRSNPDNPSVPVDFNRFDYNFH